MAQRRRRSKKSQPSYFMSIVGVALVLFLLGILGVIVIQARQLSTYFRENIEIQVILHNETPDEKALELKQEIDSSAFAKSVEYIDKEKAAEQFEKDFGENFVSVLDGNPLYSSINFKANSAYVNEDSLAVIEGQLLDNGNVREVYYQRTLVDKLDKNVRKIGTILFAVSVLLGLVVVVLIDNTIRLAMFSNRFLIKTMQMVGATRWFIAKPFDLRSVINGTISAVLAIAGILGVVFYVKRQLAQSQFIIDVQMFVFLFLGMIILGICISLFSTHRSVTRYLKMRLDDLY